MKAFKDLGFSDSFMFGKVMEDPILCRRVLETLLQTEIGELSTPLREKELKYTKDGKAIRLDVFTREIGNSVIYDAEMQNLNGHAKEKLYLPKRTRFYQAMIDANELKTSDRYDKLAECNIIFICTFDPFDKGLYRYTFKEFCEELKDFELSSGMRKIFFNTMSTDINMPEGVKNLFVYIDTGIVTDDLTREIEAMVEEGRNNKEWELEYMKTEFWLNEAKREGREEGAEEGIEKGIVKGRIGILAEGLRNGISEDVLRSGFGASEQDIEEAKAMLTK